MFKTTIVVTCSLSKWTRIVKAPMSNIITYGGRVVAMVGHVSFGHARLSIVDDIRTEQRVANCDSR